MYCTRCGQQLESTDVYCPNCGAAQSPASSRSSSEPAAENTGNAPQSETPPTGQAYTRTDYNPGQANPRTQPSGSSQFPKTGVTPMIIFSIINIVTFGFGISFVLGIIALVYTIMASNSTEVQEMQSRLHTAKTLNIVGLVITILQIIVIISVVIASVTAFVSSGF